VVEEVVVLKGTGRNSGEIRCVLHGHSQILEEGIKEIKAIDSGGSVK